MPVVYTSSSLSLAALETLVHIDPGDAPADLVAFEIDLPDHVPAQSIRVEELPEDWNRIFDHPACLERGERWIRERSALALIVPSALVPEEQNVLLDPSHPDMPHVQVVRHRAFAFDPRLL